jgi:putative nucleotidyltransferase with HDIG domain
MKSEPPLTLEEVKRCLPAITCIVDENLRASVLQLTTEAPEYFWTVPASTGGFHHPVCRQEHGLWAHTLMVYTGVERLIDSYEARFSVESDHARAAALLHDMRKNGSPENPSEESVSDHDLQMANVVRQHGAFPDVVADAVAEHMGAWYDGPEPNSPLAELVHNADMLASTANATVAIPRPVPEELEALGVDKAAL